MNAQNAHEYLPLVQALANGKTIQYKSNNGWTDIVEFEYSVFDLPSDFRIKPEPRTFTVVRNNLTGSIYSADTYDGSDPNMWECITVMEVLK